MTLMEIDGEGTWRTLFSWTSSFWIGDPAVCFPPPPKTTIANTASEVKSSSLLAAHMDTAFQNNKHGLIQMLKWLQAWMHICHWRWWRKASPGHVYCC
ncbi:hypothetical protein CapIbe_010966 [Capra ibex]